MKKVYMENYKGYLKEFDWDETIACGVVFSPFLISAILSFLLMYNASLWLSIFVFSVIIIFGFISVRSLSIDTHKREKRKWEKIDENEWDSFLKYKSVDNCLGIKNTRYENIGYKLSHKKILSIINPIKKNNNLFIIYKPSSWEGGGWIKLIKINNGVKIPKIIIEFDCYINSCDYHVIDRITSTDEKYNLVAKTLKSELLKHKLINNLGCFTLCLMNPKIVDEIKT